MSIPKLPYFNEPREVAVTLFAAMTKHPDQRPGQALCYVYEVPQELEDSIWEVKGVDKVISTVWKHFSKDGYQK